MEFVNMAAKIDWIEGTIKNRPFDEVLTELKPFFSDDFTELEYGGHHYSHSAIVCGDGRVYWSPDRPEMGVHVSLPSQALAIVCGERDRLTLARDLRSMGMEFTRDDFCVDDTAGLLDLDVIMAAVRSGAYVSRFKKWLIVDNSEGGRTIGFGKRGSDSYIRIYDKAKEQHENGHRIRVELELRRKRAQFAMLVLLDLDDPSQMTATVFGLIRSTLDFRIPSASDETKSRWEVAQWWAEFFEFCGFVHLFIPKEIRTVEDTINWLRKQVSPSMLVAMSKLGSEGFLKLASDAVPRLRPKHIAMMREGR